MNPPPDPRAAAMAAGATVEAFNNYKAKAPDYKFRFELASDIEIVGAPEWAIEDLMPLRGLAAIYGPPSCGKSFLALDATMHVATGREWFGKAVQAGGVVYIAAEAGTGFRKRVKACLKGHGIRGHIPFAMVSVAPNLGTTKDGSDAARLVDEIERQVPALGRVPLRIIVIDTLARTMYGADENSAADMGAFIANAGRIAEHFGCLVIAVHHAGKDEERGMRGSSALHGACDAEWQVKALGETKTVLLAKNKEGEDGLTWGFRLAVETVFDPAGNNFETSNFASGNRPSKPITSCYVEPETFPKHSEAAKSRRLPKGVKKEVLDAFREALADHGEQMPQSPDLPAGVGVKRSFVKQIAINRQIGNPDNPKSQDTAINRALSDLSGDGWLKQWQDWVWSAS